MTGLERQRAENLELANRVRVQRAQWRMDVRRLPRRDAVLATVSLLRGVPDWASGWSVARALLCIPGFGSTVTGRMLRAAGLHEGSRIGSITERQREVVVDGILQRSEPLTRRRPPVRDEVHA